MEPLGPGRTQSSSSVFESWGSGQTLLPPQHFPGERQGVGAGLGPVPTLWTLWGHSHGGTGTGPSSDIRGALCPQCLLAQGWASMASVLEDRWGWGVCAGLLPKSAGPSPGSAGMLLGSASGLSPAGVPSTDFLEILARYLTNGFPGLLVVREVSSCQAKKP